MVQRQRLGPPCSGTVSWIVPSMSPFISEALLRQTKDMPWDQAGGTEEGTRSARLEPEGAMRLY